jgi:hypothetical protein
MKKFTILNLMLLFASCSCDTSKFPKEPTHWRITIIKPNTALTSLYYAEPINTMDLNAHSTWFVDSVWMYDAGDTIYFTSSK